MLDFPQYSRILLNELFSRQERDMDWRQFDDLGYDDDEMYRMEEAGVFDDAGNMVKSVDDFDAILDKFYNDKDDYSNNDEDDDDDNDVPLQKSENDIKMSVKAIICQDYNADGDKKFLILEDAYSDWWDLPGGHMEDGETSDEALMREVSEETGLECDGHEEIFTRWMKLGNEEKPVMFFFSDANGEVELSEEHTDHAWITLKEINDYNLGKFADILEEAFQEK